MRGFSFDLKKFIISNNLSAIFESKRLGKQRKPLYTDPIEETATRLHNGADMMIKNCKGRITMVIADERLSIDVIIPHLKASNKKQLLQTLARKAAAAKGLGSYDLMDRLWEKELRSPSGIGDGLAIPHLKVPGLNEPFTMFARLNKMIEFDALDGEPVDMVFLLLSPETESNAYHLRRLSCVTRILRQEEMRKKLHNAYDASGLEIMFMDKNIQQLAA